MKLSNRKGFSTAEGLLLSLLILLIAGVGYYVWQQRSSLNPNANGRTFVNPKQEEPVNREFLNIEAWGIKIELTDSIKKLTYAVTDYDSENTIFLYMSSLEETDCNTSNGGIGFVKRFSEDELNPETKKLYKTEYTDATKIGDYFFGFGVNPIYETCSTDQNLQEQAELVRSEFKDALKKAEQLN